VLADLSEFRTGRLAPWKFKRNRLKESKIYLDNYKDSSSITKGKFGSYI